MYIYNYRLKRKMEAQAIFLGFYFCFLYIYIQKTETENFCLFSARENGSLFSLVGTVIDVCYLSKRAHLWEKATQASEVGAGAFFALSRSRARSENKSAKARRKKSAKKSESAERESKKSANSRFFLNPKWKSGFRAQSRSAGGKAKVLREMFRSVC